jgi:hypothetical protein
MNIDDTLLYLKKHGPEIGEAANHNNLLALAIISAYKMYRDCPEAGAEAMLTGATDDWIKQKR